MRRALSVLRVADAYGTGVALPDLLDALPEGAPASPTAVAAWLRSNVPEGRVADGTVYLARGENGRSSAPDRAVRSEAFVRAAQELVDRRLGVATRWIRCVAVTGSAAYGGARADDDCDLFVVTRRGAVWPFLLLAYLRLRSRPDDGAGDVRWCLNYVLDDARAVDDYRRPQGFHFALEALMARVVHGGTFYRGLLRSAVWMDAEAPRLYARRGAGEPGEVARADPAPWGVRVLNTLLFVPLGAYLQTVGLVRNARLRRSGRAEKIFRTQVARDKLTFESREFERLTEFYRPVSTAAPSTG